MDPQKRHSYLERFEYPPFDRKGGKYGRLESLEQKGTLLIMHFEGGDSVTVRADLELAPLVSVADVLAPRDLVWVSDAFNDVGLLAPCLLQGVDPETPSPGALFDLARSRQWQSFLERLREFFKIRDFTEVRTPTLVTSPGLEPFLDPFKTRFELGRNTRDYYLPTSPEFHLKKMLSRGWSRIFEFKECFRNNELSPHHQPEFLMLEWYRAYSPFEQMIADVRELLVFLQERFAHKRLFDKVETTTMAELFEAHAGVTLTPKSDRSELISSCRRLGVHFTDDDGFDDLFARIFLEKIEGQLGAANPVIVSGFPPSQAALARLNREGWADRFELYWRGFELANAFHELNDPREQRRRFKEFLAERARLGKPAVPVDDDFLRALEVGMPPSVGIALGVERLFLAFLGERQLAGARAFPVQ